MTHYDTDILNKVLDGMTPVQRREWIIKMMMSRAGSTYQAIAKKARISTWYLAGSVAGRFPWSKRVLNALEAEFREDLSPLLTEAEAKKCGFDIV